jgi:RIO kinase 2
MELLDAYPLCVALRTHGCRCATLILAACGRDEGRAQVHDVADPGALYSVLMNLLVRLAEAGLIHGDFNEFNILLTQDDRPILIDFPQMVSTTHPNAAWYFDRDVECVRVFFKRRFGYESRRFPRLAEDVTRRTSLDVEVEASGFARRQQDELERLLAATATNGDEPQDDKGSDEDEDEDEDDEDDEEGGQEHTPREGKDDAEEATPWAQEHVPRSEVRAAQAAAMADAVVVPLVLRTATSTADDKDDNNHINMIDEEEGEGDATNTNRARRPFRNEGASVPSALRPDRDGSSTGASAGASASLDADEIRRRVRQGRVRQERAAATGAARTHTNHSKPHTQRDRRQHNLVRSETDGT